MASGGMRFTPGRYPLPSERALEACEHALLALAHPLAAEAEEAAFLGGLRDAIGHPLDVPILGP
jgi:hypothetical protein